MKHSTIRGIPVPIILTNCSRVNDPLILAHKQQKMAIFDKTDFWGLKYPLEVRFQHETCSTICGTPVPAILNHKNSTGSAGGAREGQNMAHKYDPIMYVYYVYLPSSRLLLACM